MSDFLVWSDTPTHTGKRHFRKKLFSIISGKYQEMAEKHLSNAAKGKENP
jgi:hypothetical protein